MPAPLKPPNSTMKGRSRTDCWARRIMENQFNVGRYINQHITVKTADSQLFYWKYTYVYESCDRMQEVFAWKMLITRAKFIAYPNDLEKNPDVMRQCLLVTPQRNATEIFSPQRV